MSSREPCEDCGLLQDHMDGCPQLNAIPDITHSWRGGITYEQYQSAEPWGDPEALEPETVEVVPKLHWPVQESGAARG